MALGRTHWNYRPDVRRVVQKVRRRFPTVVDNTYEDHPWPNWDGRSVDFWGPGGRGSPIDLKTSLEVREFLMNLPGEPHIRHTILLHTLWTSFGGFSYWAPDDHSGWLRHLHVTYW